MSVNHYTLGSVGEWLYADVAGISQSPDSIAFQHLVIRPHPGGRLTWAEAAYDTPNGRVSTRWKLAGGEIQLDVVVPPGAVATVHVPTTDAGSVRESGRPPSELVVLEPQDNAVVFKVPSGRYSFTARV